jgi:hypothetical protein
MIFFTKFQDFLSGLEERHFYYYISAFLGIIIIISSVMAYYQYDTTTELLDAIETINDERETKVRPLLNKGARVKRKLKDINTMLAQETDFKIGEYFKKLKHFIPPAKEIIPTQTDHDDKYRETSLKANFTSITMQQLLELLKDLEQTERIYIKELDIRKSVKTENSIDVELTIATLLPKLVETD